jgi:DNA-binding Xre family transcriptional regulator
MNKSGFGSGDGSRNGGKRLHSGDSVEYLLRTEHQILQLISAKAPKPKILNEICSALDCQVGNTVSVVSLSPDDSTSPTEMAQNAALFGLHVFFSGEITADNGEQIGTLDMYSCFPRKPVPRELQWIGRAVCLAAIAVGCRAATLDGDNHRDREDRLKLSFVPEQPISMN